MQRLLHRLEALGVFADQVILLLNVGFQIVHLEFGKSRVSEQRVVALAHSDLEQFGRDGATPIHRILALDLLACKRRHEADGIKNAVAQRTLQQIVSAERTAFTGDMFDRASKSAENLGLELVDARVQKIGLPPDVESRVYASMQQSFGRLARQLRGEGEKEALRIRAEADRKRTELLAVAARDSLKMRGEGDAKAAALYSAAYGRNPEFYSFYRSLQAYKNSLGKEGDLMVVSPDSDFFRYLRAPGGGATR